VKARIGTKKIPTCCGAGTDPKQFQAMPFVDRTAQNEAARMNSLDAISGNSYQTISGHKRMAGMP
jgi:hypothetical protein